MEFVKITLVYVKKIFLELTVLLNVVNLIVIITEHVITQMEYAIVILLFSVIYVRIRNAQMNALEKVSVINQKENVFVMINGMEKTVQQKNVLIIAQEMDNV